MGELSTILITGASGFMGHWIARLAPSRYRLRLFVRPSSDLTPIQDLHIPFERFDGDLADPASLRDALKGCSGLIHAAGLISFDRREASRVYSVNFAGTRNLFEVASIAGVDRVVYTASIFALGYADPRLVTENSGNPPKSFLDIPYVRVKVDVEHVVGRMLHEGLPLVRLYPGICLGPGDRNNSSNGFVKGWLRGLLPALVNGGICYVDVRDAADAHWRALERGQVGGRYLLPGYNLTHRQLFSILSMLAGRPAPPFTVPPAIGVAVASVYERVLSVPPLFRDEARLMTRRWWYDDRRARKILDVRYRPLTETIQATLSELV